MINDRNKKIGTNTGEDLSANSGAITYNHLNLPYQIKVKNNDDTDKGSITYIYDATGNKLEKIVDENASAFNSNQAKKTTTAYVGSYIYENNSLQFFGHEEGRVRQKNNPDQTKEYVYDYFLKDHLGNVRAVLTDEQTINTYSSYP